jgi:hypothetical protein
MASQTDPRPVQTTVAKGSQVVPARMAGSFTVNAPANGRAARAQRQLFLRRWRKDHPGSATK